MVVVLRVIFGCCGWFVGDVSAFVVSWFVCFLGGIAWFIVFAFCGGDVECVVGGFCCDSDSDCCDVACWLIDRFVLCGLFCFCRFYMERKLLFESVTSRRAVGMQRIVSSFNKKTLTLLVDRLSVLTMIFASIVCDVQKDLLR